MLKFIFLTFLTQNLITQNIKTENGISILTTNKLSNFTTSNKNSLILTYLPNCVHCKNILNFLPSLSEKLKTLNINVGKLNAESNKDFKKKINIQKFPHLRMYINNLYIDYPFEMDEDKIYNWIKVLVERNFNVQPIRNKKTLDRVLKKELALIFKYEKSNPDALEIIKSFSVIYNMTVYIYETKNLENFKHDEEDYLFYLHRNFDDGPKSFSGKEGFSGEILQRFMNMFFTPSIFKMSEKTTNNVFKNRLKTLFVFDENYDTEVMNRIKKLAMEFKGNFNFVMSNKKEVNAETLADLVNVQDFPSVRILEFGEKSFLKYKPENLEFETLKKFIQNGIDNKNVVFYKKEEVPKKQGFVKKIVRENYKKIVLDSKKHVFIAFTTNWCEHCKEVDTAFAGVKTNILPSVKNVIFAKANYSLNDFDIVVKSFPTIYLFKKGNKKNPIEYELIRDWEVMLDFIGEKTNIKLYNKKMPEEVRRKMPKMPDGAEQVEL